MVDDSRFQGGQAHRVLYFWHYMGNKLLTLFSDMFTNLNLTDMETCYKVFRIEILNKINIEETYFWCLTRINSKSSKTWLPDLRSRDFLLRAHL